MELLKGYESSIKFDVPSGLVSAYATAAVKRTDSDDAISAPVAVSAGIATVTVPYDAVFDSGEATVTLDFTYNGKNYALYQDVEILTPILPLTEVALILNDDTTITDEVIRLEAAVRYIIQSHCGQKFSKFVGIKKVHGRGDPFLRLPVRLISVNSINNRRNLPYYIQYNGFMLLTKDVREVKWSDDRFYSGVPITDPYTYYKGVFALNAEYNIDGVWGWESVPAEVQEAARLLINDYACSESVYRDRYLISMTAADWRIQYVDGAYANTGNVRANQLLEKFRISRIAVI